MFCCELAVCCKHKISRWHHQFIWHLNNYPSLIGFNGGRWLDVCSSSLKFFASPACCVILICSHIFQRATQSTHFWPDLSRCSHDSGSKHILYSMLFCVSFWGKKKHRKALSKVYEKHCVLVKFLLLFHHVILLCDNFILNVLLLIFFLVTSYFTSISPIFFSMIFFLENNHLVGTMGLKISCIKRSRRGSPIVKRPN